MQNGPNGHGRPSGELGKIEIVRLRRVSHSQPAAWEGTTRDNRRVHISYRFGELNIEVRENAHAGPGWHSWRSILRIRPEWMLAEIHAEEHAEALVKYHRMPLPLIKSRLRMELEQRLLGEIRALNGPAAGKGKPRGVSFWELREWLEARNTHFELLRRLGAAGGPVPIALLAWSDGG